MGTMVKVLWQIQNTVIVPSVGTMKSQIVHYYEPVSKVILLIKINNALQSC
jgi:hypothetical protein